MPKITFKYQDGTETELDVAAGTTILEAAHQNDISLEGACEGSLACSTCHVIVDEEFFDKLDEPAEEEEDMLDLAFGLTHTSRLGCQIKITDAIDGIKVLLPSETRNIQSEAS